MLISVSLAARTRLPAHLFYRTPAEIGHDPYWRRNQWIRFAWYFYGRRRNIFKFAMHGVLRAMEMVTFNRREVTRYNRELWELRLDAAAREHGLPSSEVLLEGLAQIGMMMDRRALQWLAMYEPRSFASLCALTVHYHALRGIHVPHSRSLGRLALPADTDPGVVSRGLLTELLVPGNRKQFI